MPGNVGRLVRAGAQGVCSVLLLVFGSFILLTGVILTVSSLPLKDDEDNTLAIVSLVVLGIGAVITFIGGWLCASLCCQGGRRGTVVQTAQGNESRDRRRRGEHRGNNRGNHGNARGNHGNARGNTRGEAASQPAPSANQPQAAPVGYLPPNPGTRPTSGGYLPLSAQQGYQLGTDNIPRPVTPNPMPYPMYPSNVPGVPQYPAMGPPVFSTAVGGQPMPPAAYPSQPPPAIYPPPSVGQYPGYVGYPGQPIAPAPSYPPTSATTTDNLPFNPHYMPVTSINQSAAPPSAPPVDDTMARPPSYNEAMSINKA